MYGWAYASSAFPSHNMCAHKISENDFFSARWPLGSLESERFSFIFLAFKKLEVSHPVNIICFTLKKLAGCGHVSLGFILDSTRPPVRRLPRDPD